MTGLVSDGACLPTFHFLCDNIHADHGQARPALLSPVRASVSIGVTRILIFVHSTEAGKNSLVTHRMNVGLRPGYFP